jgi:hypothetical protein
MKRALCFLALAIAVAALGCSPSPRLASREFSSTEQRAPKEPPNPADAMRVLRFDAPFVAYFDFTALRSHDDSAYLSVIWGQFVQPHLPAEWRLGTEAWAPWMDQASSLAFTWSPADGAIASSWVGRFDWAPNPKLAGLSPEPVFFDGVHAVVTSGSPAAGTPHLAERVLAEHPAVAMWLGRDSTLFRSLPFATPDAFRALRGVELLVRLDYEFGLDLRLHAAPGVKREALLRGLEDLRREWERSPVARQLNWSPLFTRANVALCDEGALLSITIPAAEREVYFSMARARLNELAAAGLDAQSLIMRRAIKSGFSSAACSYFDELFVRKVKTTHVFGKDANLLCLARQCVVDAMDAGIDLPYFGSEDSRFYRAVRQSWGGICR